MLTKVIKTFLKESSRQIIGGVLLGIFVATMVFSPLQTNAQWVVFNPTELVQLVTSHLADIAQWAAEEGLKTLRDQIVKRIVDDMTNQIVNSIQNGGKPLFVTDWKGYLAKSGDIAFDTVNNYLKTQGVNLCAPLAPELQLSFASQYAQNNLGLPVQCRYQDFQANLKNTQDFIQKGGWLSFQQLFYPENNYFGMSLTLENAYMATAAQNQQAAQSEAAASNGFLDVKQCVAWQSPLDGTTLHSEQAFLDAGWQVNSQTGGTSNRQDSDAQWKSMESTYCTQNQTVTPGEVAAQAATKGVLSNFDYASNVQSVISALVNVVIGKVFNAGQGLLQSSPSSGGGVTLDYSNLTQGSRDQQIQQNQNAINGVIKNYTNIISYLATLKNLATQGNDMALNAVKFCFNRFVTNQAWGSDQAIGPPNYGYLRYDDLNKTQAYANLGDLVPYPLQGFPTSATAVAHNGYFNDLLTSINQALPIAQKNVAVVQAITPDDLQSATTSAQLLSTVENDFNTFTTQYSDLVSSAVIQQAANAGNGPGTSGGSVTLVNVLQNVLTGLSVPAYPMYPGDNTFYCEART